MGRNWLRSAGANEFLGTHDWAAQFVRIALRSDDAAVLHQQANDQKAFPSLSSGKVCGVAQKTWSGPFRQDH